MASDGHNERTTLSRDRSAHFFQRRPDHPAGCNGVNSKFAGIDAKFDAINRRFDDMRDLWRAELHRVEEVIDARLKHLEGRA